MIDYSIKRTIEIITNYSLLYLLPFALFLICMILFFKNYKKFDRWMKVTGSILIFLMFINWLFSLIEGIACKLNPNRYEYGMDWIILLYFAFVTGISVFLFLFIFFIHKFIKRNIRIARILSIIFSLILISSYIILLYLNRYQNYDCNHFFDCIIIFAIYILPILLIFYSFFLIYLSFRKKKE